MNDIMLVRHAAVLTGLLCLAGCASETNKPSSQTAPRKVEATAATPPTSPTPDDFLRQAAAKPSLPFEGDDWQSLFDGQTLTGWRETQFAGRGEVQCRAGLLVLNMGDPFTGVNYTNEFPKMNEVYATFFENAPPARATVEVARLPRDVKVEISAIAVRP